MNRTLKSRIFEKFGTQADFAENMNTHESYVSHVVRGRRELKPEDQIKWARALKTDVATLFPSEAPK